MSKRAQLLQQADRQGVFYITGGGSSLISELLTTAGASKSVLEASVPYATQALHELLGAAPEQACSRATARALAMAAFQRAEALSGRRPFGLACTASLATDRRKRGAHRAHVALQTSTDSCDWHFDFAGSRPQEERALVEGLWQALTTLAKPGLALPHKPQEPAAHTSTRGHRNWRAVLTGSAQAAPVRDALDSPKPGVLLPGSFNPLHDGHRRMLAMAEETLGVTGAFELSIVNVDKPSLDYSSIKERAAPFSGRSSAGALWITALPTFIEKARVFPGAAFAVGADTITRIGEPRYYGSVSNRNKALAELASLQTRFLVFGRASESGFQTLQDLRLPRQLRALCEGVDESAFRSDVSSTALRAARQQ
ncbi:MAG: hypothetical protein AB8B93_12115 [Pseudomonadales bacterium]